MLAPRTLVAFCRDHDIYHFHNVFINNPSQPNDQLITIDYEQI